MDIEQDIKDKLKEQRLGLLKRRYFELQMDKKAQEINGYADAATELQKRMDEVQKAYDAIQSL